MDENEITAEEIRQRRDEPCLARARRPVEQNAKLVVDREMPRIECAGLEGCQNREDLRLLLEEDAVEGLGLRDRPNIGRIIPRAVLVESGHEGIRLSMVLLRSGPNTLCVRADVIDTLADRQTAVGVERVLLRVRIMLHIDEAPVPVPPDGKILCNLRAANSEAAQDLGVEQVVAVDCCGEGQGL